MSESQNGDEHFNSFFVSFGQFGITFKETTGKTEKRVE